MDSASQPWPRLASAVVTGAARGDAPIRVGSAQLTAIRIPKEANHTVRLAAAELARYLETATGRALGVSEGEPGPGCFFVGAGVPPTLAHDSRRFRFSPRGYDRVLVAAHDGCLYLVGENPRASLYAVYDFLQDCLGLAFFAPGPSHEYVPRLGDIAAPADLLLTKGSDFELRDYPVFGTGPQGFVGMAATVDFLAKRRINCVMFPPSDPGAPQYAEFLRALRERGMRLRGPGHVWRQFMPDDSLFATHPEYFPLRDGVRARDKYTICFSNPEAVKLFVEKVREYVRKHQGIWDIFAFWPEDIADQNYCECPECVKRPNAEWYLMIVNQVAPIIEQESPGTILEFIAYHSTRTAPARAIPFYKDGAGMLLNLCLGYDRDLYTPIAQGTSGNQQFIAMFDGWQAYLQAAGFRGATMIMDYYNLCEDPDFGPRTRAYLWPLEVMQQDDRYYLAHGLDGVGNWTCADTLAFPTPFVVWAWLQVWNDTTVSLSALEEQFYPAYFGPAGEAARRYLASLTALMHARTTADNVVELAQLRASLDAIDMSALDDTLRHRVEVLKIHHEYCMLLKRTFLAFASGDPAQWQADRAALEGFFTTTHREQLKDDIDLPPMFAETWWFMVDHNPGWPRRIFQNPIVH